MSKDKATSKATMGDVAHRAGVSAATVARVLYNNGYVRAETRLAVEAAVKSTGYRPNVVARGLRTNRSFTIGLIICEERLSSVPQAVVHAVQAHALEHGFAVFAFNSNGDSAQEERGVHRFLDHLVDAVIFYGPADAKNVTTIIEKGLPAIQLERVVTSHGPSISVSPVQGLRQAVDRLYALGHRRIAYVGGEVGPNFVDVGGQGGVEGWREQAFIEALQSNGLSVDGAYVLRAPYFRKGSEIQPSHEMMERLLALPDRPTAVIFGSDAMAASALQTIAAAGLQVPRDISVVGFDDSIADILSPRASSIAQPVQQLGKVAIDMVVAALKNSGAPPDHLILETRFVERQSTGSAPT